MLFRETIVVYCENHMEHTNALWCERVNYCWFSPAQLFLISGPAGPKSIFFYLTTMRKWQNAEFYYFKTGATYSKHWALKS
jgi:hypothetical protein